MNGYIAFYRGARIEIYAETKMDALRQAQIIFQKAHPRRKIKSWDVTVALAETNGEPVIHSTTDL
jgi:hypothetical protein